MFAGPPPLGDRMGLAADWAGDPGGVRVAAAYARASSFAAAASRLATSSAISSVSRSAFISRRISSAAARSSLASAASFLAVSSSRRSCLTLSGVSSGTRGLKANSSSPGLGDVGGLGAAVVLGVAAGVGAGASGDPGADGIPARSSSRVGKRMGAVGCASGMDASRATAKSESSVPVPASDRTKSFHDVDSSL